MTLMFIFRDIIIFNYFYPFYYGSFVTEMTFILDETYVEFFEEFDTVIKIRGSFMKNHFDLEITLKVKFKVKNVSSIVLPLLPSTTFVSNPAAAIKIGIKNNFF